jgi:hypothetical protein
MRRISSSGATVDGRFKETPAPATKLDAGWLNVLQDEFCNVITNAAGGDAALDPANSGQLLAAILHIVTNATAGLGVRKRGVITGTVIAGTYYFPFPTPFPSFCAAVVATGINSSGSAARDNFIQVRSWNADGFYYVMQASGTGGDNTLDGLTWIAEGE